MTYEVIDHIPQVLLEEDSDELIAPSFKELNILASIDKVDKRVVIVKDESKIVIGCAVCYIEQRRYHGVKLKVFSLFGYHLHDYNRIFCKNANVFSYLKKAAIKDAKDNRCDIIIWENVPIECVKNSKLKIHSEMKIFSSKESTSGWSELYNRRSVKRFINKAKRLGEYKVEVIDGEVCGPIMEELKAFHILRWKFAQSSSSFESNKKRIDEYQAITKNKHYLRIFINGDLLACHYGMKYGKTLLWHTPVINPRYLDLSPLRILLSETAKYCERCNLEMLDFGLGDEEYKNIYVNKARFTYEYIKPLTIKGLIAYIIGHFNKQILINSIGKAKRIIRLFKNISLNRYVNFYEHKSCNIDSKIINSSFNVIKSWPDFYDYSLSHNFQPLKWHYDRFYKDPSTEFISIADSNNIFSYGWASRMSPFYVGETNRHIKLNDRICLYDFVTPVEMRNKGYYTHLLKCANAYYNNTIIYAKKNNKPSIRAIERSGFNRILDHEFKEN